jgi:two-component system, OmpR family, sensor histidine kinase BaeS
VRRLTPAAVTSLNEEAIRLSALIEDLHFLALSDLSGQPCRFAPANVVALCERAVARFRAQAEAAGLSIEFESDGRTSIDVYWDAARIDQLLANLLTNSLRYTDSPGRVRVSLDLIDDKAVLTVDDTAPGVPPEHLDQLFAPLYRLDAARSRVAGGSGLGLAVSEAIVRAHGGTIAATPSTLGGLTIRVELPRMGGR